MIEGAGFLIVKIYPKVYHDNKERYGLTHNLYAIPRIDKEPEEYAIQYRGLDRNALDPFYDSDDLAEIRMSELEKEDRCIDGFLFDPTDVADVLQYH